MRDAESRPDARRQYVLALASAIIEQQGNTASGFESSYKRFVIGLES